MENKNSKTGAIIGTIAAVLFCGCPGLCVLLYGVMVAFGLGTYSTQFGDSLGYGSMPGWLGYVFMCASLIMIAIPIVVGVVTLKDKKPKEIVPSNDEPSPPIPPTS
ncbi:hypothetical protein ACFLXB_08145 [Chloroflexota bacterium]